MRMGANFQDEMNTFGLFRKPAGKAAAEEYRVCRGTELKG